MDLGCNRSQVASTSLSSLVIILHIMMSMHVMSHAEANYNSSKLSGIAVSEKDTITVSIAAV